MRLSEQLTAEETQQLETLVNGLRTFKENECPFTPDQAFEAFKFKFPKGSIKLNGMSVRSIHIYCNDRPAPLFEIKFYENSEINYMIVDTNKLSIDTYRQIFNAVIVKKSLINHAFVSNLSDPYNWKSKPVDNLYNPLIHSSYTTRIYPSLAQTLETVIADILRDNSVCILSAGCGNGDEFIELNKLFIQKGIQAYIGGFDINATNVANAAKKAKSMTVENSCFMKGDLKQTAQLLPNIKRSMNVPESIPTIVIFCGVLTPGVVLQHLAAMQIMQNTRAHCDYVLLSGFEPVMLNTRVLKHIGFDHMQQGAPIFEVSPPDALTSKQTHLYKVQSPARRSEVLTKHSNKRSVSIKTVDLQMSASILEDIQLLLNQNEQAITECTMLDISRGRIDAADYRTIDKLLTENFSSKPRILVAGDEQWLKPLSALLIQSGFTILHPSEIKYANLSVNMFSRPLLRRLKENNVPVDDAALQVCQYK